MAVQYVFLALLVLSAQGFSDAKSIDVHDERGLTEEVGKLIQQLQDLARYFLENSLKVIEDLYNQLQGAAKEELEKALEELREIVDQALADLKKIVEEVQALGGEVRVCVDNEEANIIALRDAAQQSMAECRRTLLNEANKVFNEARAAILDSIKQVTGLWDEFTGCGNIFCQIGAISKIPVVIDAIKANVNGQIASIQIFVSTKLPEYITCNQKATTQFVLSAAEIKTRIETCVSNIGQ